MVCTLCKLQGKKVTPWESKLKILMSAVEAQGCPSLQRNHKLHYSLFTPLDFRAHLFISHRFCLHCKKTCIQYVRSTLYNNSSLHETDSPGPLRWLLGMPGPWPPHTSYTCRTDRAAVTNEEEQSEAGRERENAEKHR